MREISFKVSAKAARLIGRESIANSEGAIAELVKNAYDADAKVCLVFFDQKYTEAPPELTYSEFQWFSHRDSGIEKFYYSNGAGYHLRDQLSDEEQNSVNDITAQMTDIWIADDGDGMDAETIEEHWMVIGTNFKETNTLSQSGRVRTGSKGIGRFALDRLGSTCQLRSTVKHSSKKSISIIWNVDWSSFDKEDKVLEDIKAKITETGKTVSEVLKCQRFNEAMTIINSELLDSQDWTSGTLINVGCLRDDWLKSDIKHLDNYLGTLVPPLGQKEFALYFHDTRNEGIQGSVSSSVENDYDYKIDAAVQESGNVEFIVKRNELDHRRLPKTLFEFNDMSAFPFDEGSFENKEIKYTKSFNDLFPGGKDDFIAGLRGIGPFSVSLMYFKKARPGKRDTKIYPYRNFDPGPRKKWLEEFGGIKAYRDNFFVRPYGEIGGKSFDWLTLGQRVAENPAAPSRKGWMVTPQNLVGTIRISRQHNPGLQDQANREGIIENITFRHFKTLVLRIIKEFEDDRSHIFHNLKKLYDREHKKEQTKKQSHTIASKVLGENLKELPSEDAQTLALGFQALQEEIGELQDEQAMLRSLATLGTVLVSFSHEMAQLRTTMGARASRFEKILTQFLCPNEINTKDAFNPFKILEHWKQSDKKIEQWFAFAMSSVKSYRRRRKWINLCNYLRGVKKNWDGFLEPRQVELDIKFNGTNPQIMAFEIDLDSIFNNLILNSVEAMLLQGSHGSRTIFIDVSETENNETLIDYRDNGPGLHESIKNPNEIFEFSFTTKTDITGNPIGSGLGLWILDSVVNSYHGDTVAYPSGENYGFRIEIRLPIKPN